jgi:hypothetical protein
LDVLQARRGRQHDRGAIIRKLRIIDLARRLDRHGHWIRAPKTIDTVKTNRSSRASRKDLVRIEREECLDYFNPACRRGPQDPSGEFTELRRSCD